MAGRLRLLVWLCTSTPLVGFAEEPPPNAVYSLSDLETLALRHNPTLAAAAANVEAARGDVLQAGLYPNPVIAYHATEIGNRDTAGQQGILFGQKFLTGGKRRRAVDAAERGVDVALSQSELQYLRVLNDLRVRFLRVAVAQYEVALSRRLVGVAQSVLKTSEDLHAARQIPLNEVLQARVETATAEIALGEAENRYREAWRRLTAVVGVPHLEPQAVRVDLFATPPGYEWDSLVEAAVTASPDVKAREAAVARAEAELLLARSRAVPDFDLVVSVRHNNITSFDNVNVQAGFPLPMFDRNQGNIRRARAELARAEANVHAARLALRDRLAEVFRRQADARLKMSKYTDSILPDARESLELAIQGYRAGQVDYLTMLLAQQTFFRASLAYLASAGELWESAVLLDGMAVSGGLRPVSD